MEKISGNPYGKDYTQAKKEKEAEEVRKTEVENAIIGIGEEIRNIRILLENKHRNP